MENYDSFYTGDIAWAAMFPRFLSDTEHAWWARNAFEVLEQQSNPSFFSLPSDAAAAATSNPPFQRNLRFLPRRVA
jgi:hypothetical protein